MIISDDESVSSKRNLFYNAKDNPQSTGDSTKNTEALSSCMGSADILFFPLGTKGVYQAVFNVLLKEPLRSVADRHIFDITTCHH